MSVIEGGVIYSNLRRLCLHTLQPLRDALGPVHVVSGFRPPKLNGLLGGSSTSQHQYGQAADIVVSGHSPLEVACWLRDHVKAYDQLIHEFGEWVHVSVPGAGKSPRNAPLTAVKVPRRIGKPRTVYVPGIHDMEEAHRRVA